MNRALERISPKPMVDGFVKIYDEFRNGCDETCDYIATLIIGMDISKKINSYILQKLFANNIHKIYFNQVKLWNQTRM